MHEKAKELEALAEHEAGCLYREVACGHCNRSLEHRDPLQSVELLLNHTVRFGGLPASYYRLVQPYQAHTCIPDTFVYCYSFALHPEDTCTPSGSANFSRIDNINMKFTLQEGLGEENVNVNIYALNWNVIRFKSGMAGLAYAN